MVIDVGRRVRARQQPEVISVLERLQVGRMHAAHFVALKDCSADGHRPWVASLDAVAALARHVNVHAARRRLPRLASRLAKGAVRLVHASGRLGVDVAGLISAPLVAA